jgi:hypothetical protein
VPESRSRSFRPRATRANPSSSPLRCSSR